MEYLISCYRRQGERGCSLLLQHYLCRQTPVCFACICTAEEPGAEACRAAVEGLRVWGRSIPWQKAAKHPEGWLRRLEKELSALPAVSSPAAEGEASADCRAAAGEFRLTMLLCIGREVLALGGGQNLLLVNTSLGTGRITPLPGTFRGCIEPGAGLLLATDGFLQNAGEERIGEVLRLSEIRTQEQADRHLRELLRFREVLDYREAVIPAGKAVSRAAAAGKQAAVLLIGREGKTGVSGR